MRRKKEEGRRRRRRKKEEGRIAGSQAQPGNPCPEALPRGGSETEH
ncbi:MAG: hypothetical protein MUE44_13035 [Oscillatoriaceae cyanobacterium Prado104]|jgi:hypothetical protein|nr:hypothetical protein [Oscillatoriaceae cyanobacterium Prado104]